MRGPFPSGKGRRVLFLFLFCFSLESVSFYSQKKRPIRGARVIEKSNKNEERSILFQNRTLRKKTNKKKRNQFPGNTKKRRKGKKRQKGKKKKEIDKKRPNRIGAVRIN